MVFGPGKGNWAYSNTRRLWSFRSYIWHALLPASKNSDKSMRCFLLCFIFLLFLFFKDLLLTTPMIVKYQVAKATEIRNTHTGTNQSTYTIATSRIQFLHCQALNWYRDGHLPSARNHIPRLCIAIHIQSENRRRQARICHWIRRQSACWTDCNSRIQYWDRDRVSYSTGSNEFIITL